MLLQTARLTLENGALIKQVEALTLEKADMLQQIQDLTEKWQQSISENAWLNRENCQFHETLRRLSQALADGQLVSGQGSGTGNGPALGGSGNNGGSGGRGSQSGPEAHGSVGTNGQPPSYAEAGLDLLAALLPQEWAAAAVRAPSNPSRPV